MAYSTSSVVVDLLKTWKHAVSVAIAVVVICAAKFDATAVDVDINVGLSECLDEQVRYYLALEHGLQKALHVVVSEPLVGLEVLILVYSLFRKFKINK